jgi:hypothetical protein
MDFERQIAHEETLAGQGDDQDEIDEAFNPGPLGVPIQERKGRDRGKRSQSDQQYGDIAEPSILGRHFAPLGHADAPAEKIQDNFGRDEDRRKDAHDYEQVIEYFAFNHNS